MDPTTALAIIGLIGAGGMLLMSPKTIKSPKIQDNQMNRDQAMHHQDLAEAGMSWGVQRADTFHEIALNNVFIPRSAPRQESTRNLDDLFRSEAEIVAYVQQYGPQFHFMRDGGIPLGVPEQSNPNVEVISETVSFRGDPGYSLQYYPRIYVDFHGNQNNSPNDVFAEDEDEIFDAGMPEVYEVLLQPPSGRLNANNNPYGPGGAIQLLNADRRRNETRKLGLNRAVVARPPQGPFGASRYPR